ncbi:glycoprotein-N-acetylgalactosamine 3-beta-galactosyltransferase 1-like [Amphiura filiformis]|uniref:glycoprotein-N-acetylgalactosamine 3-beta-galactosyltransferase 1-like n=1 Tax=Amphiura filiformis TaxID=82378 RepID=UPI003B220F8C
MFAFLLGVAVTTFLVKFARISHVITLFDQRRRESFDLSDPYGHVKVDESNAVSLNELREFQSHNHDKEFDQDILADVLYSKVRILCWVMTNPANLHKKTIHIKATWAKRCNKILYISSEVDPDFPTVKVKSKEGRNYLWQKTRHTFQLLYEEYLDEADWFIKADDDTFLILENLRYLLSGYDPSEPIYFGRKFKPYVQQGYMSGGAGYVVSRAGVKNLVEKVFTDSRKCKSGDFVGGAEDVEIGKCLQNAGVKAGDSRDPNGRDRFHPFIPEHHLVPGIVPNKFWYWNYVYYKTSSGPECCSDYSISFHYVSPNAMYLLEYMIYHMKPFGVGHYTCPSEAKPIINKLLVGSEEGKAAVETGEKKDTKEQEGDKELGNDTQQR